MTPRALLPRSLRSTLAVLIGLAWTAAAPANPSLLPSDAHTQGLNGLAAGPLPTPSPAEFPAHVPLHYFAQSGDSLPVVAARFGLRPDEILSPDPIPSGGFLAPGQLLLLPPRLSPTPRAARLLPDSEVVDGPSQVAFDTASFLKQAGGFLGSHREYLNSTGWTPAAEIIDRVALENSVSPRLLLTLLEITCGCVRAQPPATLPAGYLLGVMDFHHEGLYGQLSWAANQLSIGYYGWRTGALLAFPLPDGGTARPAPDSNAGSVALQYLLAQVLAAHAQARIAGNAGTVGPQAVYGRAVQDFTRLHQELFGDAWDRDRSMGPIFPAGLEQPDWILPFEPGWVWSFSSGPHKAWETEGALAALDFAPASLKTGCTPTDAWVVAVGDGPVVRSGFGIVIQDLDGVRARR